MSTPGLVQSALGDEEVAAQVPLKGEDALYVTPTRTIIYSADGLLSDESVDEYPHNAERITITEGRRKATVHLDYGLDGEREFSVPAGKLDDVLHPVLAGVLNAAGVTSPGETVKRTYRFSELTLVVTSERVVKHVGAAVWDTDIEEIPYADVTGFTVEEGSVASQLVMETGGRQQRVKTPNEETRDVKTHIEQALLAYYDASSYEEFERIVAEADPEDVPDETSDVAADATGQAQIAFAESDLRPIDASSTPDRAEDERADSAGQPTEASESRAANREHGEDGFGASEFESAVAEQVDVEEELATLREALDRQERLIARQRELLDAIETAVSRGR